MIHRMKAVQKLHPLVTWKFEKGAPCKPGETAKSSGCIPASGEGEGEKPKQAEEWGLGPWGRGGRDPEGIGRQGWEQQLEKLPVDSLEKVISQRSGPAKELTDKDRVIRQIALNIHRDKVGGDATVSLLDEIDPPPEVEGPEGLGDVRFPGSAETRWAERRLALTPKVDPEVWGRLSEDQVKSIAMYTGHLGVESMDFMRDINGRLRGQESGWEKDPSFDYRHQRSKDVDNYTKGINESIDQVGKFEKPVTVYRGMGSGGGPKTPAGKLFKELRALKPGDKFSLAGFQSTSLNPAVLSGEEFMGGDYTYGRVGLEIMTEHGLPILDKSGYAGEQEILLGHDWEYEVKGIVENPNAGETKDGKIFSRDKLGVTDRGRGNVSIDKAGGRRGTESAFQLIQVIARPKKKEGTV